MLVGGLAVIVCLSLLTAGLAFALERLIPAKHRRPHNDVIGFVYAVVGVSYAVLLGLVVVATWDTQDQAKADTFTEASALVQLDLYGHSLPQPQRHELESLAKQYARTVIGVEWPELAHHRSSPQARAIYRQLQDFVQDQEPTAPAALVRYQQALDTVTNLGNARRERIDLATEGIPVPLWVALVLGAVITVGFAYFFGMKSVVVHALVMFSLTLLITSLLLVPYELNYPFAKGIRVSPTAFVMALERMDKIT
jgi:hypothetical protein